MIDGASLWAGLPLPALLFDRSGVITDCNGAAEAFLNLSQRAVVGQAVWDTVMVDAALDAPLLRAWTDAGTVSVGDVDVGSGARAPEVCNVQFAVIQGGAEQMLMLISPLQIAAKATRNQSSARAARSVIGMAEMLAHEIKNPLAGITGAAQLLSMGLTGDDLELTDLIVGESRRIVQLLDQVEEFGNHAPPVMRGINIHDVLDRARRAAVVSYGAHMIFQEDYDPSLPDAYADADKLQQIVMNLIKNACEAGLHGGTIRLRTYYDASLRVSSTTGPHAQLPLQIEVIDDGPGFPPMIAGDVFEPFVSGRENGTGLGLALVSKLIDEMGGFIAVKSVPGRTVFHLALARAPATGEN